MARTWRCSRSGGSRRRKGSQLQGCSLLPDAFAAVVPPSALQVLGNSALRISWGRSSSRAAHQAAQQAGSGFAGVPGQYPAGFDGAAAAAMAAGYQIPGAVAMPMGAYAPGFPPGAAAAAAASQQDLWVSSGCCAG